MVGPSLNTHNLTLKPTAAASTIKFLCSYGGRILPRHPDGKLRYHGGQTRFLAVPRSISFAELLVKLGELCGTSVSLRCQLPTEDLDALVSITSDEDLANLIEEYDRTASPESALKIKAFLSPPKSTKKISPPPSITANFSAASSQKSIFSGGLTSKFPNRCVHRIPKLVVYHPRPHPHPLYYEKSGGGKVRLYQAHPGNPSNIYPIHNGNHWQ